jgi:hypothetical protein
MIHQRQRLPFRFESPDDLARVHAELDDFDGHAATHRFSLFGHVNDAKAAHANFLNQFVAANGIAFMFGEGWDGGNCSGRETLGTQRRGSPVRKLGSARRTFSGFRHGTFATAALIKAI